METMSIQNKGFIRNRIHPHKFALWLAMASMVMMFAAFTSAYIVKQAAGNWLEFRLPSIFFINTAVIILSSIALEISYRSFLQHKEMAYRVFLLIAFLLGITFVVLQVMGWNLLFSYGIDLKGNPSGSFLYLITGVHAAHVVGGIAALFVALFHSVALPYKVTDRRKNRFQLVIHYWHFVDLLWIYLFVFLLVK